MIPTAASFMVSRNRRLPPGFTAMMHSPLSATKQKRNLTGSRQVTELSKLPVNIRNTVLCNFSSKLQLPTCQTSGVFPRAEGTFVVVLQGEHLINKIINHFPNNF
jgi:hypothetical protein